MVFIVNYILENAQPQQGGLKDGRSQQNHLGVQTREYNDDAEYSIKFLHIEILYLKKKTLYPESVVCVSQRKLRVRQEMLYVSKTCACARKQNVSNGESISLFGARM